MPFYLIGFLHFYNAHHAYLHPFFPGHFGHEGLGLRGAEASGRRGIWGSGLWVSSPAALNLGMGIFVAFLS